jgi:hypothetical protein
LAARARAQAVQAAVEVQDFAGAAAAKQGGAAAAAALDAELPALLSELRQLYTKSMDLFMRM